VTDCLPELLDAKALRAELGITRAAAEAVFAQAPRSCAIPVAPDGNAELPSQHER
jgi:hypothetical protein